MIDESREARERAERDAATQAQIRDARSTELGGEAAAVTGTGTGDNRDETNDSAVGATLGGVGGALAGAAGLAVDAVDQIDDDNTLIGLDDGEARDGTNTITPEMRAAQEREAARDNPNRSIGSTLDM